MTVASLSTLAHVFVPFQFSSTFWLSFDGAPFSFVSICCLFGRKQYGLLLASPISSDNIATKGLYALMDEEPGVAGHHGTDDPLLALLIPHVGFPCGKRDTHGLRVRLALLSLLEKKYVV